VQRRSSAAVQRHADELLLFGEATPTKETRRKMDEETPRTTQLRKAL
jgi:hypothetical protein